MLFRNTYTAIDRDMQRIEPGPHQPVRVTLSWERPARKRGGRDD